MAKKDYYKVIYKQAIYKMPNVCVYFVNNTFTLSNNKTEIEAKMSLCSAAYFTFSLPKI